MCGPLNLRLNILNMLNTAVPVKKTLPKFSFGSAGGQTRWSNWPTQIYKETWLIEQCANGVRVPNEVTSVLLGHSLQETNEFQ